MTQLEKLQSHLEKLQADLVRWHRRYDENDALIPELKRLRSPKLNLIKGRRSKAKSKIRLFEAYIATARKRIAALEDEPPKPVGMTEAELGALRKLAALCDQHAQAFGDVLRKLHVEIAAARQRNDGRGPPAILVWSQMERCATRYFEGTILRSLRSSPRLPQQLTFAQQVERWMTMLAPPPVPPLHAGSPSSSPSPSRPPAPPPPPAA
jgi:hypothetical protein